MPQKMMIPCTELAVKALRKAGFTDMKGNALKKDAFPDVEGPFAKHHDVATVTVQENETVDSVILSVTAKDGFSLDFLVPVVMAAGKALNKPLPAGF